MKKANFSIIFFCIFLFSEAQTISGSWYGVLEATFQKIPLAFHIKQEANGSHRVLMDSPAQKIFGVKADTVIYKNDSLYITMGKFNIEYAGKVLLDTAIHGKFNQGTLNLNRNKTEIKEIRRPQTPKPPFSYNTKDTIYFNKDKSIQYGATLTYPKTGEKFPAIILITGSGPQDRDETLFEHKPFFVLADYLTKLGYAVLRIDDRGVGKTTGNFYTAGTKEYIADANAAIDYLQERGNIDPKKIGLMGHSLGGIIAPMVASQNKDVAFIVSLAGVGVTGKKLLQKQRQPLSQKGRVFDASDSLVLYSFYAALDSLTATKNDAPGFVNTATLLIRNAQAKLKDSVTKAVLKTHEQYLEMGYRQRKSAEYHSIITYDPTLYFKNLKIPFLAINGSEDIQVDADMNLNGFKNVLTKAGNKNFNIVKLEGLNHLFQQCKSCQLSEYGTLEETFSPEALKVIGNWLDKNIKK